MAWTFNPFTSKLDFYKDTFSSISLIDSNGDRWIITVDTGGNLVSTAASIYLITEGSDKLITESSNYLIK